MIATFTLPSTTFAASVAEGDTQVNLTSTTGVFPGIFLFANREALKVTGFMPNGNAAVLRGQNGTATRAHATNETVWVAPGYQLFDIDPQGTLGPKTVPLCNPHINVQSGAVWVTVGDDDGPMVGARVWQQVTTTTSQSDPDGRQTTTFTPS